MSDRLTNEDLLTVATAARLAEVTPDGIRKATARGALDAVMVDGGQYRVRLYRRRDVEAYAQSRRQRLTATAREKQANLERIRAKLKNRAGGR